MLNLLTTFKYKQISVVLLLFFLFTAATYSKSVTKVDESKNNDPILKSVKSNDPYCGLYCLYISSKLLNHSIDFCELLKPQFIGSHHGSSMGELKIAAQENGLHAETVGNLSALELRHSPYIMLLHVKANTDDKAYNHFITFLGEENGYARLYDPPEERLLSLGELASIWDGNVLIVSDKAIKLGEIYLATKKRFMYLSLLVLLLVIVIHGAKSYLPKVSMFNHRLFLSILQGTGIVLISLLTGLFVHFANETGFLFQSNPVQGIQQSYAGSFIPKITQGRMQKILARKDAVIVDARLKRDYDAGHIKSAISLPINCSDDEYRQTISTFPKDKKIVLYCQSAGCQFAEKIALRLKEEGFKNLSIFKGGWVEWQKAAEAQSAKSEDQKDDEKEPVS